MLERDQYGSFQPPPKKRSTSRTSPVRLSSAAQQHSRCVTTKECTKEECGQAEGKERRGENKAQIHNRPALQNKSLSPVCAAIGKRCSMTLGHNSAGFTRHMHPPSSITGRTLRGASTHGRGEEKKWREKTAAKQRVLLSSTAPNQASVGLEHNARVLQAFSRQNYDVSLARA